MWTRLLSLMALPALGSAGLLLGFDAATGAGALAAAGKTFGLSAISVVMFVGFTAAAFSFPIQPLKALAVTFGTPVLLLISTLLLQWGAWEFFVDECFAELGGMAVGAAAAAIVAGGGGIGVRILGAMVFAGGGAAALWLFGRPMLAMDPVDPVWVILNAAALVWSTVAHYQVFAHHARNEGDRSTPSTLLRPTDLRVGWVVVVALMTWVAALVGSAAWAAQA